MTPEYLFYDIETWGTDPASSRLVEIAWQRTDSSFHPLEPAQSLVCRLPPECIPSPEALLVHNKTPSWVQQHGISEYQFARRIHAECNRPGTCIVGYNNIRFDDEHLRFLFYRNLLDPYTHQYKNGNSRWDIFDLVKLAFALRSDTLRWPANDTNTDKSLKLADLAQHNNLSEGTAHDASSDVATTIALTRKIFSHNPRMVNHAFTQTRRPALDSLVAQYLGGYCLHLSPRIPRSQGHLSLVMPLCRNRQNNKQIYAIDLNASVDMLLTESVEQLREMLFTKRDQLPEGLDLPRIKTIHLNRAPLLLDPKLLSATRAAELGIDTSACMERFTRIKNTEGIAEKIIQLFDPQHIFADSLRRDADLSLYDGFIPDHDKRLMDKVHTTPVTQWQDLRLNWQDSRIDSLWLRIQGRENPQGLSPEAQRQWQQYLQANWRGQLHNRSKSVAETLIHIQTLLETHPHHQGLHDIQTYLQQPHFHRTLEETPD